MLEARNTRHLCCLDTCAAQALACALVLCILSVNIRPFDVWSEASIVAASACVSGPFQNL